MFLSIPSEELVDKITTRHDEVEKKKAEMQREVSQFKKISILD
jgi:hypothetical protein